MTNIYGVPDEVSGYAPREDTHEQCPFCNGRHTQFLGFEFTNIDDKTHMQYFCMDCETDFSIAFEIPYLQRQTC